MPDNNVRFHLYSDTSRSANGSVVYQFQYGQPRLITYTSKRVTPEAQNYTITVIRIMWISYQYCEFYSFAEDS